MGSIKNKIIELIKSNRISSTEVADALGKKGVIKSVYPLNEGMHKVGEVQFFYAFNNSNWELHEQIENAKNNTIAFFYAINCEDSALFGDLVSKYLLLYKQVNAIVVDGYVRDVPRMLKEKYPIWAKGKTPIGCFNKKNTEQPDQKILLQLFDKFNGGIMVCDDSGVVLIEPNEVNEQLFDRLEFIEFQEDVWYFCMDRHKMSTYEIVCEKKYLEPNGLIDEESLQRLAQFSNNTDDADEK